MRISSPVAEKTTSETAPGIWPALVEPEAFEAQLEVGAAEASPQVPETPPFQ